jgi:hypothetical protein
VTVPQADADAAAAQRWVNDLRAGRDLGSRPQKPAGVSFHRSWGADWLGGFIMVAVVQDVAGLVDAKAGRCPDWMPEDHRPPFRAMLAELVAVNALEAAASGLTELEIWTRVKGGRHMRHLDRRLHKLEASSWAAAPAVGPPARPVAKEDENEEATREYLRLVFEEGMTDEESRARGYRMDPSVTRGFFEDLRAAGLVGEDV